MDNGGECSVPDGRAGTKHQSDDREPDTQKTSSLPSIKYEDIISKDYRESPEGDRGLALLIQNFNETNESFDADFESLMDCLGQIENKGLEIYGDKVHTHLTADKLVQLFDEVSKEEFEQHYCLLVVILGPGRPGLIECKSENGSVKYVELTTLIEKFQPQNCPTLALKPKVFIVQTMMPKPEEDPNQSDAMGAVEDEKEEAVPSVVRIPRESDILTYTSDQPFSLGNNGFLKSITEVLQDLQKNWSDQRIQKIIDVPEIQSLLVQINRKIKKNYHKAKIPCTMSSLTRRMYLQRREV